MNQLRLIFAVLTAAACLSACQSQPAPTVVIQEPAVDLHTKQGQVAVITPESHVIGTADAMKVTQLKTVTDTDKLLVEATVKNERGRRDILYYRLRWLDNAGVMLGQYEPWATESLDGFQEAVITATSPYSNAADFRLEIRGKD